MVRSKDMKELREKMQDNINEVNKTAHQVKGRLEHLDKMNETAMKRKVRGCTLASSKPHRGSQWRMVEAETCSQYELQWPGRVRRAGCKYYASPRARLSAAT